MSYLYKAGVLAGQSKWFALRTPLRFAIACIYLFLFVMLAWVILANDNYKFPSPPSFHIPFIGRPSEWASDHGIDTTWVGLIVLVLTWVGVVKIAARNHFGNARSTSTPTTPASSSQTDAQVLFFKSSESAFEAACKYGGCDLKEGSVLVAIVLDTRKIIGGDVAVKTLDDGRQRVSVLVCAADGGFSVIADTPSPYGPKLEPGNLVSWRIGGYSKEAAAVCGDQRCGWVGLVTAKLKPEYSIQDGWKVDSVFGAATTNSPTPARAMELAQNKVSPSARYGSSAEGANRFKKIVMFCVIAAMAVVVGRFIAHAIYDANKSKEQAKWKLALNENLQIAAAKANKGLPSYLNGFTRFDRVTSGSETMTLSHTILDWHHWSREDKDRHMAELPRRVCADEGMKAILKAGATVIYSYSDKSGAPLFFVPMQIGDCK